LTDIEKVKLFVSFTAPWSYAMIVWFSVSRCTLDIRRRRLFALLSRISWLLRCRMRKCSAAVAGKQTCITIYICWTCTWSQYMLSPWLCSEEGTLLNQNNKCALLFRLIIEYEDWKHYLSDD
jgi:hypothetical protein